MATMIGNEKLNVHYHPDYFDEDMLEALFGPPETLTATAVPESCSLPLDDSGGLTGDDAAYEQAWKWMKADPELAAALEEAGLAKKQVLKEIRSVHGRSPEGADLDACRQVFESRLQIREEGETITYLMGDVEVLTTPKSAEGGNKTLQVISLVLDILALIFVAFSIRVHYKTAKVRKALSQKKKYKKLEKMAVKLKAYGLKLEPLIPELEKGKKVGETCSIIGAVSGDVSDLLKTAAKAALKSMNTLDYCIAIGSLLASIAVLVATEGAELAARVGECLFALVGVADDIVALC